MSSIFRSRGRHRNRLARGVSVVPSAEGQRHPYDTDDPDAAVTKSSDAAMRLIQKILGGSGCAHDWVYSAPVVTGWTLARCRKCDETELA